MGTNPLNILNSLGQSPWYDFITRDLITSGELARLIEQDGLRGMTTNPTIFEKAVSGGDVYDGDIRALAAEGKTPAQVFEALAVSDVRAACDVFAPVHRAQRGHDGLVSLEVSPTLARDTAGTIAEAERLWERIGRGNAMIKIPGTREGLPAITECLAQGINVNVTLLFSVARYREVMDAFMTGLERRAAQNLPIDGIASVASFFVSRLDGKVDPLLEKNPASNAQSLRATAAVANACAAYSAFQETFAGKRWKALAAKGARVQRPLWASTSTKDPRLPDIYYVEALIAEQTVNTLPPATFAAYRDHGQPELRMAAGQRAAPAQLAALKKLGIDLDTITQTLEVEGVASFAASYASLLAGIEAKMGALAGAP
ncbi:MAG TPA: transaldolase [Gemmatimonadales bacterium]|nr:transaldolase [Gemmatimonadales bacterium]